MSLDNNDKQIRNDGASLSANGDAGLASQNQDNSRRKIPITTSRASGAKSVDETINITNESARLLASETDKNKKNGTGTDARNKQDTRVVRLADANGSRRGIDTRVGNDTTISGLIKYQKEDTLSESARWRAGATGERGFSLGAAETEVPSPEMLSPKRLRELRFRTMMNLMFPLTIAILLGLLLIGLVVVRSSSQMMINEIVRAGVMKTTSLVRIGGNIINQATLGANWPVTMNLISQSDFDALCNAPSLVGRSQTEKTLAVARSASLLKGYFSISVGGINRKLPVKVAYIYSFLPPASADVPLVGYGDFPGEMGDLARTSIIPDSSWLPWYVGMKNHPTVAYFSEVCDIWAAKIIWSDVREHDDEPLLMFRMRINATDGGAEESALAPRSIGYVMLGIAANELLYSVNTIRNATIGSGLLIFVLATLVCFYFTHLTTRNTQELLVDMNKAAGGEMGHLSLVNSNDAIGELAKQFNRMIKQIAHSEENKRKMAAIQVELDVAREIQMKLLPERLPKIKGFDVYADYKPAKEVGGDYYDFFPINRTHVGIIVADVSGKGVPACVVMATTRTILRFVAVNNTSSADTLKRANVMLASDIRRGMFVTAFYLVLNVLTREITCSSAGHNPMVIVRSNGTCEKINPKGIALGFDKGRIFDRMVEEQKIRLNSGDRVVLYTDGVVEAMNLQNEEYTDERFYRFSMKNYRMGGQEFVNALLVDLDKHRHSRDSKRSIADQHDDITVVTLGVQ